MALALTERRLVVCRMNRFTGHPSKMVWWTTVERVKGVRAERGCALGSKILKFEIELRDGTAIALDVPREHLGRGEDLVAVLGARTSLLAGDNGSEPARSQ
jgi:hypothetical protein